MALVGCYGTTYSAADCDSDNNNADQAEEEPKCGGFHVTQSLGWNPRSCTPGSRGTRLGHNLGVIMDDGPRAIRVLLGKSKSASTGPCASAWRITHCL